MVMFYILNDDSIKFNKKLFDSMEICTKLMRQPNILPYLKKLIILDHWQSSHQVIFHHTYFSTVGLPRTIMLTLVI